MKYHILDLGSSAKGQSGEGVGSNYNLTNACKNCGTGAELVGNLRTKGLNSIKESILHTFSGDILVSENVQSILKKNNLLLKELTQAVDQRDNPTTYYHINPKISFPKASAQSQGLKTETPCPVCRQNGYFNDIIMGDLNKGIKTHITPIILHYSNLDETFLKQSDIFHTWEHMGLSNLKAEGNKVVRYARPLLIVSERLKIVLEGLKIKKLSFYEIIIHRPHISMQ